MKLVGTFHLPLVPDGLPVDGQMQGTFEFPQTAEWIDAELEWQHNRGQLLVTPRGEVEPILTCRGDHPGADHHQRRPLAHRYEAYPLRGRVALSVGNWQQGTEQMIVSGRLNVLTEGMPGRAMRY